MNANLPVPVTMRGAADRTDARMTHEILINVTPQ
jgi:hypothetical protein